MWAIYQYLNGFCVNKHKGKMYQVLFLSCYLHGNRQRLTPMNPKFAEISHNQYRKNTTNMLTMVSTKIPMSPWKSTRKEPILHPCKPAVKVISGFQPSGKITELSFFWKSGNLITFVLSLFKRFCVIKSAKVRQKSPWNVKKVTKFYLTW